MTRKLLIMAGGTGGHVFPGLAVADFLTAKNWQIHWLGTSERMEAQIVPKAGYSISFIDVAGVRGNGITALLLAPFKIVKAIVQARKIIKRFDPDVVLGMGGFASGPGGVAAWTVGKPLILHEQNAVPGFTNKMLSYFASKIMTGFAHTFVAQQAENSEGVRKSKNAAKYQWVGNPVRAEFVNLPSKKKIQLPLNILVVGGSLGSKPLNDAVPLALAELSDFEVRHQCGKGHLAAVESTYQQNLKNSRNWQIEEFVDDMPSAYKWADLVICRAGALTVAEVAAAGISAIFVPLPHAVDDHQTQNALALVNADAAYLLPQNELFEGGLGKLLDSCFAGPQHLLEMGDRARKLAKFDAAEQVSLCCINLAEQAA
ncbi:MAG: UDP-N-acetylglucosamine--N-acetylmuramyl-(pentapeptide) pyrophosphoryl-undecaprenol N-acetylglucosamine transferase [Paraglaciecola sp.]|jgi:UDP-N-acetylglucosamine--N-acetylmuramyl-(pentapeptide) pyrophosphoryl-undecaprenol N-acetylglucosamine transferase